VTIGATDWEEEVQPETPLLERSSGAAGARAWEHTALSVADLSTAIDYYRHVFGYEVVAEPHTVAAKMQSLVGLPLVHGDLAQLRSPFSHHTLELVAFRNLPSGGENHGPTRPGAGHVSFVVDDVTTARKAVENAGGTRLGEITLFEDGLRAYCRDPSGATVELVELHTEAGRSGGHS